MKASELCFETHSPLGFDRELSHVTENASLADAQSVFVCIRGARFDGHDFSALAYHNGCRVFVAERPLELPEDASVFLTSNARRALALLACQFFGDPSKKMHLIGITGTKGKTTTALLLSHILNSCGIPCGYIGTNGVRYRETHYELNNTTPDAVTLQKALCDMQKSGVSTAVMEVSSQALKLYRTEGVCFSTLLFTNLSPDHIGQNEHEDLADYMACKKRLFTDYNAKTAIFNLDDPFAKELLLETTAEQTLGVSTTHPADFFASPIELLQNEQTLGITFTVFSKSDSCKIDLPLIGSMNAENLLLALAAANTCFGIPLCMAGKALSDLRIEGRSEMLALPNGALAIIDYAHNGDSLRRLLTALRAYNPNRLIVLFGSVGERTKGRRRELGLVASTLADVCILTSDNPAKEAPEAIISDILQGFAEKALPYYTISDRAEAIRFAVSLTQKGDILVLAGKGHEAYQQIGSEKIPFSERVILQSAILECCGVALKSTTQQKSATPAP